MKTLLAVALTFSSFAVFANEPTTAQPTTAETIAAETTAVSPVTAAPAEKTAQVDTKKMSRKAAKKACQAEGKKGTELKTCIAEKKS